MGQKDKLLVTEEGAFDLSAFRWDDHRFSDLLVRENPIDPDQAIDISRFLRKEINKMEPQTITMSVIEKIVEAKLQEYGLTKPAPIRLDKSFFVDNGLALSDNAKKVLERRYLKTDSEGNVIESPGQMFRRVANHIAGAENKNDGSDHVEKVEEVFYRMMTESKFLPNFS
jgi:ribonucleoside-diphosphate reductase alpha chain